MPAFKIKGVNCKQLNYASSSPSIRVFLQLHSQRAEGGPAQGTNLLLAFADFALSSYQQLIKKSRKALIATPLGTISKQNKTTTAKENTTLYELFLYFFNLD